MKTVVVIQARTGSTRMPNKVLMPLAGRPLLQRMVERVRAARTEFDLVVATTTDPGDNAIRELCRSIGVRCFSGHPTDLLERHYRAAIALGAEAVVKIPSDCPLIDPAVIDRVLAAFFRNPLRYDYVSNLHPPSYPDGNDVEAMTMATLEMAWVEAKKPFEREHTTPFVWERAERFRIGNATWESGLDYSMSHRWTIDYPDDYEFIRAVYDELWSNPNPIFTLKDILLLLHARPDMQAINSGYAGVNWYRHHLGELKTIAPEHTRMPAAV